MVSIRPSPAASSCPSRSTVQTSFREVSCRNYRWLHLSLPTGLDEEQAADMVKQIVSWGIVDILEVSGGTYASPGEHSYASRDMSHSQHSPPPKPSASPLPLPPASPSSRTSRHPSSRTFPLLPPGPPFSSLAGYTIVRLSPRHSGIEHATWSVSAARHVSALICRRRSFSTGRCRTT